jgi:hypothetical protein
MQQEGLGQLENAITSSGMEPVTFWLVASFFPNTSLLRSSGKMSTGMTCCQQQQVL